MPHGPWLRLSILPDSIATDTLADSFEPPSLEILSPQPSINSLCFPAQPLVQFLGIDSPGGRYAIRRSSRQPVTFPAELGRHFLRAGLVSTLNGHASVHDHPLEWLKFLGVSSPRKVAHDNRPQM